METGRWLAALLCLVWLGLLGLVGSVGCGEADPEEPPQAEFAEAIPSAAEAIDPPSTDAVPYSGNAGPSIIRELRQDRDEVRTEADRGGRASLLPGEDGSVPEGEVGRPGRFRLAYEAGPLGVAVGGSVQLQVSPFWGWSEPQVHAADLPGYTEVSTEAAGVELAPSSRGGGLLVVEIGGRALVEGERIEFLYGAGAAGTRVDRYAEERSPFFFAVDGDGDGRRAFLADAPVVRVRAGRPVGMVVTLPSVARPGESVTLRAAVLDGAGNTGVDWQGNLELVDAPESVKGPRLLRVEPGSLGLVQASYVVEEPGLVELTVRGLGGLEVRTNPLLVDPDAPRLRWADLHGHSVLSDGTGTPDAYYRYARDVAGLDVAALTDHDHWGLPFLDETAESWSEIRRATEAHYDPGRFVTIHGYEWTSWLFGHRHVLHFGGPEEAGAHLHSFLDEATDTPPELWDALRGEPALTFAHHSAGSPVATSWEIAPDPVLEPLTEVTSVHGNSESPSMPNAVGGGLPGNWVPDALARGYRLGFVGSGDSHDGHPGLAHLGAGTGGLAAIEVEELTREAVLEALRARRTYATSGPRILLSARLDGEAPGSVLAPIEAAELRIDIAGTEAIERVEVVRDGEVVAGHEGQGERVLTLSSEVGPIAAGSFVYVRVVQRGGGSAWSSPWFFEASTDAE
ncbi:MAG: CehA/McbA family metallohydrolase [Myxococcota bacterium]|nr:CehA/McbA family metallohydrolase [Myxococcota bacterium]